MPSPTLTATANLGAAAAANLAASDFTAEWPAQNGSSAKVDYTGSDDLASLTRSWSATLYAPDGTICGTDDAVPDPSYVPAGDCVQTYGDKSTGWHVKLSYADATDGDQHTVDVDLAPGTPPGYQACTPTGFTAQWGQTVADGVGVSADGGELSGCRGFQYQLAPADGSDCGRASGAPPATVVITCGTPPDADWTVTVTWTNPDGSAGRFNAPISGDPPPA